MLKQYSGNLALAVLCATGACKTMQPLHCESRAQHLQSFLESREGQTAIKASILQAMPSSTSEAQRVLNEARARSSAEECRFKSNIRQVVTRAALCEILGSVNPLQNRIPSLVSDATFKELPQAVLRVIPDDPKVHGIIAGHLHDTRIQLKRVAEEELAEISNEEQHQKTNSAFLAGLEEHARISLKETLTKSKEMSDAAFRSVYLAKAFSMLALTIASYSLFRSCR